MGKIAEALEKAGFEENLEQRTNTSVKESPEAESAVEPLSTPENNEKVQPPLPTSENWDERLFKAVNDDLILPEVFKVLRSRILHPQNGGAIPKTIMVTSAIPKEGKSFISANLGISLAQGLDQHSLLVDCDLRRSALATMFGMEENMGLVDYLQDGVPLSELIRKTSVQKLTLLPGGEPPVNPAELLGSARMSALVAELSERYDDRTIIFDSPPALAVAESSVLAGLVDGVIIVVRQGGAGKSQVQKLVELLGVDRVIGLVFNDHTVNYFEKSLMKGYGYYNQEYY